MQTLHQILSQRRPAASTPRIATIHSISNGTARLCFADGATSQKHYRLNPSIPFAAGQKVRLERVCGTYMVTARI